MQGACHVLAVMVLRQGRNWGRKQSLDVHHKLGCMPSLPDTRLTWRTPCRRPFKLALSLDICLNKSKTTNNIQKVKKWLIACIRCDGGCGRAAGGV